MTAPALHLERVTKRFFGILALENVSFDARAGEVHAVVGENGAGKSTLMKLLVGVHTPDAGRIVLEGAPVSIGGPEHARRLGIDIVYQELELPANLTVMEALLLGREPRVPGFTGRCLGRIDHAAAHRWTTSSLARVGLEVAPAEPLARLSVAERQLVQIARALSGEVRLLILDEPTSALTEHEAERLFTLLADLRARGTTILYVSHRLEEIFRLADRVTVLRDGRHVATAATQALTRAALVEQMLGRAASEERRSAELTEPPQPPNNGGSVEAAGPDSPHYWGAGGASLVCDVGTGEPRAPEDSTSAIEHAALDVRGLTRGRKYEGIDFAVRRGEVVGMFGIIGAGRTEIARGIFGLDPIDAGEVRVEGRALYGTGPSGAVAAGLARVPEDRQHEGLVLGMSVGRNLSLAALPRVARAGWVRSHAETRLVAEAIRALSIRPAAPDREARSLSGGNQQKVVIARWLATGPSVLILDEPTRGIDVGAKREIHALIRRLAAEGLAVLLISSELEEALSVSDRLLVLRRGRIAAELDSRRTSPAEVMSYAV